MLNYFVVGVRPRAPTFFMADEDIRHARQRPADPPLPDAVTKICDTH
jgi:hypothetical protein